MLDVRVKDRSLRSAGGVGNWRRGKHENDLQGTCFSAPCHSSLGDDQSVGGKRDYSLMDLFIPQFYSCGCINFIKI